MIIYSDKDFVTSFIKLIKIFFIIFIFLGIFSGFIVTKNILISLIVGGLCIIFALLFIVLPLVLLYIVFYYPKIKGSIFEINKNGIEIGKSYFGPLKSLREINIWHAKPTLHNKNLFIPWNKIKKILFYKESTKNVSDFIAIFLGPRTYFVIKSEKKYYVKVISGTRWDIHKKIKDAIKNEKKDFLFTEKFFYASSSLEK